MMKTKRFSRLAAVLSSLGLMSHSMAASSEVHVSLSKEQKIAVFEMEKSTGELSWKHEIETPGSPGAMAFNEAGDRLYVAMKSKGGIASLAVNGDGQFELLNHVAIDGSSGYLAVHPSGDFLLSSYYSEGMVSVHRIDEDGRLSEEALQVVSTEERAHAVVTDPTGKFVFVPHTRPNSIHQFFIDEASGLLMANSVPKLVRDGEAGPRHLWFHPEGSFAFGSDEQGKAVTSYQLSANGVLSVVETVASFPEEYVEKGSTADIEVHPSGQFVYIANRGVNTIAVFEVNPEDGTVNLRQQAEVEPVPRSFNISPDGKFLVAAGQQSGNLVAFEIDDEGSLLESDRLESGGSPWWVVFRP